MVTALPLFPVSCICKALAENKIDQDPGDTSVTRLHETEIMGDSTGYPPKEPKKIVSIYLDLVKNPDGTDI